MTAAFHGLRVPGAFLLSGEKRGALLDYLVIESLAGGTLRLANPWPGMTARVRDADSHQEIVFSDEAVLDIPTVPDQLLILDRPAVPHESFAMRQVDPAVLPSPSCDGNLGKTVLMGCQGTVLVDAEQTSSR